MEKIKKYDVIIMIILISVMSLGYILCNPIVIGDEFILLNHILKMCNRKSYL